MKTRVLRTQSVMHPECYVHRGLRTPAGVQLLNPVHVQKWIFPKENEDPELDLESKLPTGCF